MSVLWVTTEPPDRNLGGGSIRQAHLLDALAAQAEVTLLLYGSRLEDQVTKAGLANLIEVPGSTRRPERGPVRERWRRLREALLERDPPEVTDYRAIRADLEPWLGKVGEHDVVIVEHPGLAPLVTMRRSERWMLTMHNVGSGTLDQYAAQSTGRWRWLRRRQARQARAFERWALRAFDLVISVSEQDARLLPGPTAVVPNGVDPDRFIPTPLPRTPGLVLVGTLHYLPNVEGATWFAEEVLPLIRERFPEATLTLVGRSPTDEVLGLRSIRGVEIHADVPDVRPHLLAARVSVVPLQIGTGTRLKALESFAAYRPVVGTSVGLAGLEARSREHALVADEAAPFAECVVELLSDDELASNLVAQARRLVESRYSWQRIGEGFAEVVLSEQAP